MKNIVNKLILAGASGALAIASAYLIIPFEGEVVNKQGDHIVYKDIIGINTACWGQTGLDLDGKKPVAGTIYTQEYCEKWYAEELTKYNKALKKSVKVPLPENMEVAYTSLVWNIGIGAWNNSTLLKKLNNKEYEAACQQVLRWNRAGGKVVKGLQNRREAEYKVCMGKDADVNSALKELTLTGQEPLSVDGNGLETLETPPPIATPSLPEINAPEAVKPIERTCIKKFLFWCTRWSDSSN